MKAMNNYYKKNNQLLICLYVLLLFPLLGENIISTVFGGTISQVLSIISCFSILIYTLKYNKLKLNLFIIIILLLIALRVIIILFCNVEITNVNNIISPYGLIGYFMLIFFLEINFKEKDKIKIIFKSMMIIMTISVFANFFFTANLHIADNISAFSEALSTGYTNSRKWLFGHRNMIFIHHLMWILFTYISYKLEGKNYSKLFFLQIIFTLLVSIISWNSTMIITTLIILVLGICRNSILSKFTILHYLIIYFVLEFGIVFFRIQDVFSYIIVNLLHRNLSFTGRTSIWNYYIEQFSNSNGFNKLFGNYGATTLSVNSHNMFLGLLSFTGIIGTLLYFSLLFLSAKELKKEKNKDTAKFISIIIFGFLINALTMEFYLQPLIAFYLGYKIKDINNLI